VINQPRLNRRGIFMERTMRRPVCKECKSDMITRDAVVVWDDWHRIWEIKTIFDHTDCLDCGATGDYMIEWIE
jgi:RNase P subunit RPR2